MELKHDWRIIIESQEKIDAHSAPDYINKEDIHLFKKYLLNNYYVPCSLQITEELTVQWGRETQNK